MADEKLSLAVRPTNKNTVCAIVDYIIKNKDHIELKEGHIVDIIINTSSYVLICQPKFTIDAEGCFVL
jgi:hypothetical protein